MKTEGLRNRERRWLAKIAVVVAFMCGLTTTALMTTKSNTSVAASAQFNLPKWVPRELWESLIPKDNPFSVEKAALGEKLYFDKRLSVDKSVSCATCHDPAYGLSDNNVVGIGIELKKGARNAPTVLNSMFNELQFWDGRAPSLEEQAKLPLINPIEMGMKDYDAVVARVTAVPEYQEEFRKVFGNEGITINTIAKAIATFERTQLSGDSPFDRFIAGDKNAISAAAQRGWELFNGQARCISCHAFSSLSPIFSDLKFHNIGVAAKDQNFTNLARRSRQLLTQGKNSAQVVDELALAQGFSELGRYLVTRQVRDIGSFKTSMLRDIELTAPYMHNGSEATLEKVVEFYNRGGDINPNLDGGMRPLKLTPEQEKDLVEFLKTLTSDLARQRANTTKPQTREPLK
jgi:cytochrome c peroxidase